ncbi:MAG: type IV pilus modification protein PilV [Pseudomonadota bacterium]
MLLTTRARGFTLVEAMVSLVVLSVGLLGAAAMLLDSLHVHAAALQRLGATRLLADMADRIRANPGGAAHYAAGASGGESCIEPAGCDIAQLAAADRVRFEATARALFARELVAASVEYEPAIGPAAPNRYVITLRWRNAGDAAGDISVALQVLAQSPVAG